MPNEAVSQMVTPLVLTYNEAPNLARTLDSLRWAQRVVVLDSGSTDNTETLARAYANVDWRVRPFDSHGKQWEFGIRETQITSEFVLALDADMAVPPAFVAELEAQYLAGKFAGGIVPFEYHVQGRPLAGSVYPAQLRVFRPHEIVITQPGHTQEFATTGAIYHFKTKLIHDDRKPLERWVNSQLSYSLIEAERINAGTNLRLRDKLRKLGVMPVLIGVLSYLRAGGPLRGAAALRYAYERATYECLLAMRLQAESTIPRHSNEGEQA